MTERRTTTSAARVAALGAGLVLALALVGCSKGGLSLGSSNQPAAATGASSSGSGSAGSTTSSGSGASGSGSGASGSGSGGSGSEASVTPGQGSPTVSSPAAPAVAPTPDAKGVVNGAAFTTWLATNARRAGAAHMVMATNGAQGAVSATGDVRLSGTGVEESVVMRVGPQTMRVLLVSDGLYMSIPSMKLPVGKKWIVISPSGTDQVSVAMRPMFQMLQSNSLATAGAEAMKGVAVRRVGTSTFGGVPVTRYAYSNTQAQIAAVLTSVPAANLVQAKAALAGMTSSTSMLVDADGLTRQVVTTTTLKGKKTVSTVTYSGWGRTVSIVAPLASEVVDPATLG